MQCTPTDSVQGEAATGPETTHASTFPRGQGRDHRPPPQGDHAPSSTHSPRLSLQFAPHWTLVRASEARCEMRERDPVCAAVWQWQCPMDWTVALGTPCQAALVSSARGESLGLSTCQLQGMHACMPLPPTESRLFLCFPLNQAPCSTYSIIVPSLSRSVNFSVSRPAVSRPTETRTSSSWTWNRNACIAGNFSLLFCSSSSHGLPLPIYYHGVLLLLLSFNSFP